MTKAKTFIFMKLSQLNHMDSMLNYSSTVPKNVTLDKNYFGSFFGRKIGAALCPFNLFNSFGFISVFHRKLDGGDTSKIDGD